MCADNTTPVVKRTAQTTTGNDLNSKFEKV